MTDAEFMNRYARTNSTNSVIAPSLQTNEKIDEDDDIDYVIIEVDDNTNMITNSATASCAQDNEKNNDANSIIDGGL